MASRIWSLHGKTMTAIPFVIRLTNLNPNSRSKEHQENHTAVYWHILTLSKRICDTGAKKSPSYCHLAKLLCRLPVFRDWERSVSLIRSTKRRQMMKTLRRDHFTFLMKPSIPAIRDSKLSHGTFDSDAARRWTLI